MKTHSIFILALLTLLLTCTKREEDSLQKTLVTTSTPLAMLTTPLPPSLSQTEFKDASGKVTIKIFFKPRLYGPAISSSVAVSSDYVLVGGGIFIDSWSKNGAFIMESRPNNELTTWIVRTSHFLEPECHYMTPYAIGLKIEGIPAATLRSKMKVFSQISTPSTATSPASVALSLNSTYKLIGGGANTNSAYPLRANMSYQEKWLAEAILTPTATTVTAYAIGIDKAFLSSNRLQISQYYPPTTRFYSGLTSLKYSIPKGWAITTIGARTIVSPNSGKRMLICMYPVNGTTGEMLSKDHSTRVDGQDLITLIGIQKY